MRMLIDGDLLLYRIGFAIEKTKYLVELHNPVGYVEYAHYDAKKDADKYVANVTSHVTATATIWSRKDLEPVEHGYHLLNATMTTLVDKYGKDYSLYISGSTNFRDRVWITKKYKGNRDQQSRPTHYEALKEYLIKQFGAIVTDGIEADDAIGIESSGNTICVSLDKDLDQIPGLHYNWVSQTEYTVTLRDAKTHFYAQLLAGDATDNIPGLPGIGMAKAYKHLKDAESPKDMMNIAIGLYKEAFASSWWEKLTETFALVYILRNAGEFCKATRDYKYIEDHLMRGADAEAA